MCDGGPSRLSPVVRCCGRSGGNHEQHCHCCRAGTGDGLSHGNPQSNLSFRAPRRSARARSPVQQRSGRPLATPRARSAAPSRRASPASSRSQAVAIPRVASASDTYTESMPSSFTPRRIKGITVVWRSVPPVSPELAMQPCGIIVRVSHASVAPPTGSTAPAQLAFSSARVPICSVSRARMLSGAEAAQIRLLLRLAGERRDLVTARGQALHGDAANAAGGAGHDHRSARGSKAVALHLDDRQRRGETRGTDHHRIERGEVRSAPAQPIPPARAHSLRSRHRARRQGRSRSRARGRPP